MADNRTRFPGPVTFNDNDPKKGYAAVHLTIPGLKVKKTMFGNAKPDNATITESFSKESVSVTVTMQDGSVFEYTKSLPEDIDPSDCSYKVKNEMVILYLRKAEAVTWGAHATYFVKKP